MKIKEIRAISGLSQSQFAKKYKIPLRSVENWEMGGNNHRECPAYVAELLERVVREDYERQA